MTDQNFEVRRNQASDIRNQTRDRAFNDFDLDFPPNNGDEERFQHLDKKGFATFTKALAHDEKGLVVESSLEQLLGAIAEGTQEAFEKIQLGSCDPAGKCDPEGRKLANPLNAYSFQLIGNDSNGARMAAAPSFASKNSAIDMVERYWMALCRDVPFDEYFSSPLIQDACNDLNAIGFEHEFGFACTSQTIFRGPYTGCDVGPHVSQFLLQDFVFGNQPIKQLQRYPREGLDYMTDFDGWFRVNNGTLDPTGTDVLVGERRIRSLRDAGQWVHIDFPYQSALWSTIILLGLEANVSCASPYVSQNCMDEMQRITRSEPFGSLGGPDVTIQPALAGVYALKHAWFQKWCVHRRLRPEVYAHRLELFRRGLLGSGGCDPLNDPYFNELFGEGAEIWRKSKVLSRILEHNKLQNQTNFRKDLQGTWFLPMAFPEGSPTHPAYPGGHSVFAAAAATTAKALFQDGPFPSPVILSPDGELVPYTGEPLTIHGELNKLIANITLFRDGAGMHWRTDGTASGFGTPPGNPGIVVETGGNLLGEKLAISMLKDTKKTYRENLGNFTFNGLNGNLVQI